MCVYHFVLNLTQKGTQTHTHTHIKHTRARMHAKSRARIALNTPKMPHIGQKPRYVLFALRPTSFCFHDFVFKVLKSETELKSLRHTVHVHTHTYMHVRTKTQTHTQNIDCYFRVPFLGPVEILRYDHQMGWFIISLNSIVKHLEMRSKQSRNCSPKCVFRCK